MSTPAEGDAAARAGATDEAPPGFDYRRRGFLLTFVLVFLAFEVFLRLPWLAGVFEWQLEVNARLAGAFLGLFYPDVFVQGADVLGDQFSLGVRRGCDVSDPAAIFLAGVLAFPATARQRVGGAAAGIGILLALNVVRIVTLYAVGVHRPDVFETMHVEVWQTVFVGVALLLWLGWAAWCARAPRA